jgi:DNA-directed RNA polymerase subunit beta'
MSKLRVTATSRDELILAQNEQDAGAAEAIEGPAAAE